MVETVVMVREFRIGSVLGRGLSVLFKNIVPFGLLSLLVMSPIYIYALIYAMTVGPQKLSDETDQYYSETMATAFSGMGTGTDIVKSLLGAVISAALVYGTFQELRNRRASLVDCIGRGLKQALPVIGVAILVGLAVGLGTLLFVIPGLIIMTMLWVAIPAAVIEKKGVTASLQRSVDLTRGYRWRVFSIILLVWVINFASLGVLYFPVFFLSEGAIHQTGVVLVMLLMTALFTALSAVVSAVGYHDLRVVQEGVGIEEIAAVFD